MKKTNQQKSTNILRIIAFSTILTLISIVLLLLFFPFQQSTIYILGISFLSIGFIGLYLFSTTHVFLQKTIFVLLFTSIIFTTIGIPFLTNNLNLLDFFLYIGLGVGLILLIVGINLKLLGWLIPGSIIFGVMPGLYFAWEDTSATNALEQTAVMLVWFALGWGLITILSRAITRNFIWWPLIPGGILAVVGWGLFIAGNPGSAIGFIGNTGSIGLIIFGIYILLMRRSFHK